jgi:hypothetical protein
MGLPAINFQSSLQIGAMDPLSLQGSQSGADFQAMLRAHHHHHHHQHDDNNSQQGQQLGQIGQSMMQTGQQMVQEGQQLIQQGDYQQGMQLIRQGAGLEQQGAQLEQQAAQGTDPYNQQSPTSTSGNQPSDPANGQNCDQGDCQQPGQIGQNLVQTGQQLIQQGQQLIQQGDYRQGMQLVREGARLEQQGAQLEQQATQGTDPFNQLSSDALSGNNNTQSDPLSQILQTISQLSQQAGQIESGMGLTSLLSGAGPLLGALLA